MQQASDFLAESEALDRILSSLGEEDFRPETAAIVAINRILCAQLSQ